MRMKTAITWLRTDVSGWAANESGRTLAMTTQQPTTGRMNAFFWFGFGPLFPVVTDSMVWFRASLVQEQSTERLADAGRECPPLLGWSLLGGPVLGGLILGVPVLWRAGTWATNRPIQPFGLK